MKLNIEQIIKALECCYMQEGQHNENCPECPYTGIYPECQEHMGKNALALIKELTEENASLKQSIDHEHASFMEIFGQYGEKCDKLTEENERLRAEKEAIEIFNKDYKSINKRLREQLDDNCDRCIERERADTVRKMQERLDKHFCHDPTFLKVEQRLIMDVIDRIAKEMLEGYE